MKVERVELNWHNLHRGLRMLYLESCNMWSSNFFKPTILPILNRWYFPTAPVLYFTQKYNKPLLWHEEEVSCSISFNLSPIKARQSQCHHQSKSEKRDIQLQFNLILHNKCHTMSIKTEKCSYKKHVLYCMRWHIKWHQKHGNASNIAS